MPIRIFLLEVKRCPKIVMNMANALMESQGDTLTQVSVGGVCAIIRCDIPFPSLPPFATAEKCMRRLLLSPAQRVPANPYRVPSPALRMRVKSLVPRSVPMRRDPPTPTLTRDTEAPKRSAGLAAFGLAWPQEGAARTCPMAAAATGKGVFMLGLPIPSLGTPLQCLAKPATVRVRSFCEYSCHLPW